MGEGKKLKQSNFGKEFLKKEGLRKINSLKPRVTESEESSEVGDHVSEVDFGYTPPWGMDSNFKSFGEYVLTRSHDFGV